MNLNKITFILFYTAVFLFIIMIFLFFIVNIFCPLALASTITLPAHEQRIISEVADEYGLSGDSRLLLFVIRRVENGGKGREMGVINPRAINTTFRNQCQWAAGTIAKRYTGDLKKFGLRWCPIITENINWYKNAKYYMKKWKE